MAAPGGSAAPPRLRGLRATDRVRARWLAVSCYTIVLYDQFHVCTTWACTRLHINTHTNKQASKQASKQTNAIAGAPFAWTPGTLHGTPIASPFQTLLWWAPHGRGA